MGFTARCDRSVNEGSAVAAVEGRPMRTEGRAESRGEGHAPDSSAWAGPAQPPRTGRAVRTYALTGASAEREGDALPGVQVWRRGRQMEDDAARRSDDVGSEFQQPVAQPGDLGARTPGMHRAQPQLLHQHVGRGGEEDAPVGSPRTDSSSSARSGGRRAVL